MRFWDSSAIVPLLVHQTQTRRAQALYRECDDIILWWGTRVECDSALARLEREGMLSSDAVATAFTRLDALAGNYHEIEPSRDIQKISRRLLRTHRLRAADALQLAAAHVAAEHAPDALPFVCFDERLELAAQREGFTVVSSR